MVYPDYDCRYGANPDTGECCRRIGPVWFFVICLSVAFLLGMILCLWVWKAKKNRNKLKKAMEDHNQ